MTTMELDEFVPEAQTKTDWIFPAARKTRVLLLGIYYPLAILSYFRHALEKRLDVELVTAGAFTNNWIPWSGGMYLSMKYVKTVDLPLAKNITNPSWNIIKDGLERNSINAEFDLILNVDAGFHLSDKPPFPYAVVATDPHVLGNWYATVRRHTDYFFNMQYAYMQDGDFILPYCCSPDHHYAMSIDKDYDASLIGLNYENRTKLVNALRSKGYKVLYEIGLVYDEYRMENNRAFIGLNWSSLLDINARTFETMAMMQVPIINRLPHLDKLGFTEGRHYLGFDNVEEAVSQVEWALNNRDAAKSIALTAHNFVHENHTYEKRVKTILETVGLA